MGTVIVSQSRTPFGRFRGTLSHYSAIDLGRMSIESALRKVALNGSQIDEVIFGCVLQANLGQAPVKQLALASGIEPSAGCTAVNKVCGSGLKSVMLADASIRAGDCDVAVVGGMESMSNAPHYLNGYRAGKKMGNGQLIDGMLHDGLVDPFHRVSMGVLADRYAERFELERVRLDQFAELSYERSLAAYKNGHYADDIIKIDNDETSLARDEELNRFRKSAMAQLKPVFNKDGVVTVGNASKINDGACALVVMEESRAQKLGLKPLARIVAQATYGGRSEDFPIAPAGAIGKVLEKSNLLLEEIELFEINEAFAMVPLAVQDKLGISESSVNPLGGAISLGHPIGASGARVLMNLVRGLKVFQKRYGCASVCLGGGEAVAMIVENGGLM